MTGFQDGYVSEKKDTIAGYDYQIVGKNEAGYKRLAEFFNSAQITPPAGLLTSSEKNYPYMRVQEGEEGKDRLSQIFFASEKTQDWAMKILASDNVVTVHPVNRSPSNQLVSIK